MVIDLKFEWLNNFTVQWTVNVANCLLSELYFMGYLQGRIQSFGRGGHILINYLCMHDITGDIKCIIAAHSNFNACLSLDTCSTEFFWQFNCCQDKLLFKARVVMEELANKLS